MMRDAYTEKRALDYINIYGPPNNPKPEYLARMKYIASFIPPGSILDVASGLGYLYAQIKRKEYVGIDSSLHMVAKAQEYFPDTDFRIIDAFNLGSLTAKTVVSASLMIHIEPTLHHTFLQHLWEHSLEQLIFTIPIIVDKVVIEYPDDPERKILISNISQITFNKLVSELNPKPRFVKCISFPPGSFGYGLHDYLVRLIRIT